MGKWGLFLSGNPIFFPLCSISHKSAMQNANCKGKGGVIQLPFWHVDEQGLMQIYSITHDSCVEVHNKISHIRTTLIVPNSALFCNQLYMQYFWKLGQALRWDYGNLAARFSLNSKFGSSYLWKQMYSRQIKHAERFKGGGGEEFLLLPLLCENGKALPCLWSPTAHRMFGRRW